MSFTLTEDRYWKFVTSEAVLRRAAHLVDKESRHDFQESLIERQLFSYYRDSIIREIIDSLNDGRYMPSPATLVPIPKSDYSQRPGTLLAYRDRIVLQAIIMCLAPELDEALAECVWSWRVRPGIRGMKPDQIGKRGLFGESDISRFPFLKKKTVSRHFDDFEPWYALWPRFDEATRATLSSDEYGYVVFSDISGYFENIQLSLLHSLLGRYQPDAPITLNLLMRHLKAWCEHAHDGSQVLRGIPQGNSTSSFLGNFFLKPVDDWFTDEARYAPSDIKYFRYMDDIRIVASNRDVARHAALDLEAQIRRSKLNLQSAKTHVYTSREAIERIHDRRLTSLEVAVDGIRKKKAKQDVLDRLSSVAADPGDSHESKAIRGSSPDFSGLNLRVLRLWAGAHYRIASREPLRRITKEATHNANYKVTREVSRMSRAFPMNRYVPNQVWKVILADGALFPYQEAELIRGVRGFSPVPAGAIERLTLHATNVRLDPYLRVQSIIMLCKLPGHHPEAAGMVTSCVNGRDIRVVMAGILAISLARPEDMAVLIRNAANHASHDAMQLINYVRALRSDRAAREPLLRHVFRPGERLMSGIYDYASLLRFISGGSLEAAEDLAVHVSASLKSRSGRSKECTALLQFLKIQCESTIALTSAGHKSASNDNEA